MLACGVPPPAANTKPAARARHPSAILDIVNDFLISFVSYCFLIVGLIVVWGGPFPWPSMTGGWWSRATAIAVARGNVVGGTFGGNFWIRRDASCSYWKRRLRLTLQILREFVQFLATHAVNCEWAASVFGVFSSSATSSHAAMNRGRIKRAFSCVAVGCKENLECSE